MVVVWAARLIRSCSTLSVWVQEGRMELKRIPSGPNSNARVFVSPAVAARTLFERTRFGMGCLIEIEVTVRTDGVSDWRKWGRAWISRTWLMKERLMASCQVASSISSNAPGGGPPALVKTNPTRKGVDGLRYQSGGVSVSPHRPEAR